MNGQYTTCDLRFPTTLAMRDTDDIQFRLEQFERVLFEWRTMLRAADASGAADPSAARVQATLTRIERLTEILRSSTDRREPDALDPARRSTARTRAAVAARAHVVLDSRHHRAARRACDAALRGHPANPHSSGAQCRYPARARPIRVAHVGGHPLLR